MLCPSPIRTNFYQKMLKHPLHNRIFWSPCSMIQSSIWHDEHNTVFIWQIFLIQNTKVIEAKAERRGEKEEGMGNKGTDRVSLKLYQRRRHRINQQCHLNNRKFLIYPAKKCLKNTIRNSIENQLSKSIWRSWNASHSEDRLYHLTRINWKAFHISNCPTLFQNHIKISKGCK